MNLQEEVGHKVLVRGDVVKSPSGSNDWVVIDNSSDGKLILACISKYMSKEPSDVYEWYKIK